MARFCMAYSKEECRTHSRCAWMFDKNGGVEYYEGAQYFDESRHILLNYSD